MWQETWNNSSGAGPTHVWVPEPGHWWVEVNNSTGEAGDPGWGSAGTSSPMNEPGWSYINATNDSAAVEQMMQSACVDPSAPFAWHYNYATHQLVRDP